MKEAIEKGYEERIREEIAKREKKIEEMRGSIEVLNKEV